MKDDTQIVAFLEEGVRHGVFSGVQATVKAGNGDARTFVAGRVRRERNAPKITAATFFDLASLTKVLATTTITARPLDRGVLALSERLVEGLPELRGHERWGEVTLREVLCHQAGFPAWRDLTEGHREALRAGTISEDDRREILAQLLRTVPECKPGARTVYSDLGFILLGVFLAARTKKSLEELFREEVVRPLGCKDLLINPARGGISPAETAATEDIPWRGGVLQGVVHDDNAYLLGGIAGHAGLFGTSHAVANVGEAWLLALKKGSSFLSQETVKTFCTPVPSADGKERALGWDVPSKENSSAGSLVSPRAFGHLGYVGTSLWIDPEREAVVALLTNRVHPSSGNEEIKKFRPRFHDLVWRSLGP